MFKPTKATTPAEYLELQEEPRKSELKTVHAFIQKTLPGLKPFILSGMIGYGAYRYKSASGKEGDWFLIGLASPKNYISIHVCAVEKTGGYIAENYKKQLPKATIGKSCISFKHLKDIDLKVLAEILKKAKTAGGINAV